jgi:metal-responsive CopG/Arc/MetJ family transcriptional regulator
MTQQCVSVRLPEKIARALDKYCKDNYLNRSAVMRTALVNWEPLKKYLKEEK